MRYVNEDEKFWNHSYLVSLASCLGLESAIPVNADNESDAVDYAVNYAEKMGWEGFFVPVEDVPEDEADIIYAGNHSRPLYAWEVHITQVD